MAERRCITLITDYGTEGPYVGAMKGAILKINPEANLVDITHQISPGNILEAAFVLKTTYAYFPQGTIHIVVVDPGVGGPRKPLLVSTEFFFFMAPDNGVLSFALSQEEIYNIFELTEYHFFLNPLSSTFHGRDIFAPCAGWLSKGIDTSRLGETIETYQQLAFPQPQEIRPKAIKGVVLYTDHFGNLITNLTPQQIPLDEKGHASVVKVLTPKGEITQCRRYYAESAGNELFFILGGTGFYEISANGQSASQLLGLQPGNEIGALLK